MNAVNQIQGLLARRDLVAVYLPLALAGLMGMLALLLTATRLRPALQVREELLQAVLTMEERLEAERQSRQPEVLRERIALAQADLEQQAARLVGPNELAAVLDNVRTLATNRGVVIVEIRALPRSDAGAKVVYERQGFQVSMEGSLQGVLLVVGEIPAYHPPAVVLDKLTLAPAPDNPARYRATVDVYVYTAASAREGTTDNEEQ